MGRNQEINQKTKDERREQILAKALMLFATKGLAATRISDIAVAAGMSQGLLYHYYTSKEEIFVELIQHAFERMNTAALALEQLPLPPRAKINLALEKLLEGLAENEHTAYYHLLIAIATASDAIPAEAKAIIQRENQVPYEVIERIILAGQQDGSFRLYPAQELALVFWTTIKGLAMHKAAHSTTFKAPPVDMLMNLFV